MSKRIFFGHNDIRFFYYRYKDSKYYSLSILVFTIAVCALLIFKLIIPQADVYFSIRREVLALRAKIKTMNDNINFVNNLDKSLLDSQLTVTNRALPADKDFAGIINAISASAVRSGVSISDFSFSLGGVSSNITEKKDKNALSPVNISLDIKGSTDGGKKFLSEISEKIPLAEVTNVKGDSNSLIVDLQFYYKSLPQISFKEDEPITPVADSKKELIRKLSSWQVSSQDQELSVPTSSSSATPLF